MDRKALLRDAREVLSGNSKLPFPDNQYLLSIFRTTFKEELSDLNIINTFPKDSELKDIESMTSPVELIIFIGLCQKYY